jgi:uncharacterized protein with HEPN domain
MPSTPSERYATALQDIAENTSLARSFVGELSFDQFKADRRTVYADIRCLEIISEASRRLPVALKAGIQEFPGTMWPEQETSIAITIRVCSMFSCGAR